MTEMEKRKKRCCFTGHRPQKLHREESDIWAGEIVVRFRETNPDLHLIAAIPFPHFSARWSSEWKNRYEDLLEKADYIKVICPSYNAGAYQRRNEWMVDHSVQVIAVFNGEKSGTKNTIDYAQKRGVQVEIIKA